MPLPPTTSTKVTQKDVERANEFLNAIKSGTLEKYFESFTDERVANLCKANHVKCGTDRSENVKRLIKKIKSKKSNYMGILKSGAYTSATAFFGGAAVMYGAMGLNAGNKLRTGKSDDKDANGLMVASTLYVTPLAAAFGSASFLKARRIRRQNRIKTAADHTTKIQKWYNTIKNLSGGGSHHKSKSKQHRTVRKSLRSSRSATRSCRSLRGIRSPSR
jgi:hypothetical protein